MSALECGAASKANRHQRCGRVLGQVPAGFRVTYLGLVQRFPQPDGHLYVQCQCGATNHWRIDPPAPETPVPAAACAGA